MQARIHPGFETQGRYHQKSRRGISVVPQKDSCPPKNVFEKIILLTLTFRHDVAKNKVEYEKPER